MKYFFTVVLILCVCAPSGAFADKHGERESCSICGMYIDQFQNTATRLTQKNGEKLETCGVACMLRIINDKGGPEAFSSIEVNAWDTHVLVPATKAVYIIGSGKIPDMMPNIIAFEHREGAEAFREKEGGESLDFTQALLSISPMGMTMPVRMKTAVLSPKGALGVGVGYMHMTMDKVKLGSNSVDPAALAVRPGQGSAPKRMIADAEMLMINYGVTDDLNLGLNTAYFQKRMETYKMGGRVTETTTNDGFGDVDVTLRYNLWKNVYYSKFFSLLAGTTLPTGDFKPQFITMPGLQNGAGEFSFTGGLLFSHRYKNFWFHYLASYTAMLENSDEYRFGDTTRFGAAAHYTPTYDLMMGLEIDGAYSAKDTYQGATVENTGGFRSNVSAVVDWKFLTAFGGTFSIRAAGGVPIYEYLNHYSVGAMEKAKLGGGYFVNVAVNFNRRFPVD